MRLITFDNVIEVLLGACIVGVTIYTYCWWVANA